MHIVIVGAGVVGTALAEQFSQEGHHVAIVEQNRRLIREVGDKMDVLGVHGNGGSASVLKRARCSSADLAIAVTENDEVNFVVGMLAKRLGASSSIVRIRNTEYTQADSVLDPTGMGIDQVINPEPHISNALQRTIAIPGCNDVATLAGGQVLMLSFDIEGDSPAAGKALSELGAAGDLDAFVVLYIQRGEHTLVPRGDTVIQPGDSVRLLVASEMVQFLLPMLMRQPPQMRHVILAGASSIAIELARDLAGKVDRLFLIEQDQEDAEHAATELAGATVLTGDPTKMDVLEEASIDRCDLFCALSSDDQANMLSCLLARRNGATKTAALVQEPPYVPLLNSLGVDIVINPRLVTVSEILTYVRQEHVHSVTRVNESRAEIVELEAGEGSTVVDVPLRELRFPKDAIIGATLRDGIMCIPTGETRIAPGDRVLIYALPDALAKIQKMFAPKS